MNQPDAIQIRHLTDLDASHITALADLLVDCVDGGASVRRRQPITFTSGIEPDSIAGWMMTNPESPRSMKRCAM